MGIEIQTVRLMLLARRMGVDFTDTLTIGRQNMMIDPAQVERAFGIAGMPVSPADAATIAGANDPFSDEIFTRLGAARVRAMDFSDYEGAQIIHDLNRPLPDALAGQHSFVFDGGTLEHVFNCPVAMANYMRLPRIGGHLIVAVPANNEMGHGFYQFSPEFFYRTLRPENGYEIRGVFLAPIFLDRPWLRVTDPAKVERRVGHNGWSHPTYIFAIAQRTADVPIFATPPQQSDYAAEWENSASGSSSIVFSGNRASRRSTIRNRLMGALPPRLFDLARDLRRRLRGSLAEGLAPFDPGTAAG